jgi:hypothetical protein
VAGVEGNDGDFLKEVGGVMKREGESSDAGTIEVNLI